MSTLAYSGELFPPRRYPTHRLTVVYKFNVLIIFCVSRCCTEAKRHAAPPHGFPAFLKRIRFFESVGLNDSLHWH